MNPSLTSEYVIYAYSTLKKSTAEIAKSLNTYPNKIKRLLNKSGTVLRNHEEAQNEAIKSGRFVSTNKGKPRTEEEKIKISNTLKATLSTMDKKEKVKRSQENWKKMSDEQKEKLKKSSVKGLQIASREGSKLEKFISIELSREGYIVEFHKKYLIENQQLEIDMLVPSLNAAIEVDGPSHYFPIWGDEKLEKNQKADTEKNGLLMGNGYHVIRIKNLIKNRSLGGQQKLIKDLVEELKKIENKQYEFPCLIKLEIN